MYSFLRTLVIGVLFFLMMYLYHLDQGLQSENTRLRRELEEATASPQDQLKAALTLGAQDPQKALAGLQRVAARFPQSPEAREAERKAAELQAALAKAQAAAGAKAQAKRNAKDLETLLKMPPFDGSKAPPRDLTAQNCRAIEESPEKFSGHRVTVTDRVQDLGGYLSFAACTGVTISSDNLGREARAALKRGLGPKSSGTVTLSGRFQGLDFYPDAVR